MNCMIGRIQQKLGVYSIKEMLHQNLWTATSHWNFVRSPKLQLATSFNPPLLGVSFPFRYKKHPRDVWRWYFLAGGQLFGRPNVKENTLRPLLFWLGSATVCSFPFRFAWFLVLLFLVCLCFVGLHTDDAACRYLGVLQGLLDLIVVTNCILLQNLWVHRSFICGSSLFLRFCPYGVDRSVNKG